MLMHAPDGDKTAAGAHDKHDDDDAPLHVAQDKSQSLHTPELLYAPNGHEAKQC